MDDELARRLNEEHRRFLRIVYTIALVFCALIVAVTVVAAITGT